MSNDSRGAPGIWTAVTHLVWVFVGEPTHAAILSVGVSATAPNTMDGTAKDKYANDLERNIVSSINYGFLSSPR
jgi:hypothetical protein